ncbi:hypothetical protein ACS0TY_016674 [Phlomoides rotata]
MARRLDLDMLEERRLASDHKNVTYKQRSEKYYNSKVKIRQFQVGDLVLKKVQGLHKGIFARTGYLNGYPIERTSSNIQTTLRTNTPEMLVTSKSTTNKYSHEDF